MQKDDTVFVGHMLDTACQGLRLVHGKTREEYDQDEALRLALVAVDEGIVWDTVQRGLKPLADKLKSILPPECGES